MRDRFNQDFVGDDKKSNVETFHETSLQPIILSQTPEEFETVNLQANENVSMHQIVVDAELQAALLSIPEIEAVMDAQSDEDKIEETQDIALSRSEKLNFILPRQLEIAAIQTKPAEADYFNEAHLASFIEYFLRRRKVWIDSNNWLILANINNELDSS